MTAMLERQTALLTWYRAGHRRLPWRADPEGPHTPAYAVVVSELMLQQTRVDTVIDYYRRWMQRWPDWQALAVAPLDDVLAQWTGLGYYNRARNLHAAAQAVVARHDGQLPRETAALQALPGLGPYTVGAVQSIAFGLPSPLVDGNVARVLARWLALAADPMQGGGRKQVWQHAATELAVDGPARSDAASWNQALMELGATVCTPRTPACAACPVAAWCSARATGQTSAIPPPRRKAKVGEVAAWYALVCDGDGALLLGQRPANGRWAGLWEPLGIEGDGPAALRQWLDEHGVSVAVEQPPFTHVLTHRRYAVHALLCTPWPVSRVAPAVAALGYTASRWQHPASALSATSGLSRLGQKLVEAWLAAQPHAAR